MRIGLVFILAIGARCSTAYGQLTDREGNSYPTQVFGTTEWMMENLRARSDSAGQPVVYYLPNSDSSTVNTYGLLYDFETASKVCPEGWRLPNNEDWESLLKLKSENRAGQFKDSNFWPGESNSNATGFSARPAGVGNHAEHPNNFGLKALYWSDTHDGDHFIWTYIFEAHKDSIRSASQHPTYAFSARCVR